VAGMGSSMGELRFSLDRGVPRPRGLGARPGRRHRARRGGIPVELRVFEMYRLRDGKIGAYRSFLSEREALEAVGLRG